MTANQARAIVYLAFKTYMTASLPTVPYCFDNESFNGTGKSEWLHLTVRESGGGQHTLSSPGNRIFRRRGTVLVQVYTPVDRGLLRLDELARAARDIFEGKTVSEVAFTDGTIQELPADGQYMKAIVTVIFTYDETK